MKKENGLPWGSVGWLVSWRHVFPSRARTRRRKRRLPRQRSDDDERAGLRHDDECTPRNQPLPELLVHTPISTKSSSSHTRFKAFLHTLQGSSIKGFSTRPHVRLVQTAVILQPDAASSDRLSLGGTSPWAWLSPFRPIGQRTRPLGVAWSQGNYPPQTGPHPFSPRTRR